MGIEEDEKEEFILLLEQKRHDEVIAVLTKLLKQVSLNDPNVEVSLDTSGIQDIVNSINMFPDLSELPASIKAIGDVISKKLETLNYPEPVKDWKHTITRDNKGLISIVTSQAQ